MKKVNDIALKKEENFVRKKFNDRCKHTQKWRKNTLRNVKANLTLLGKMIQKLKKKSPAFYVNACFHYKEFKHMFCCAHYDQSILCSRMRNEKWSVREGARKRRKTVVCCTSWCVRCWRGLPFACFTGRRRAAATATAAPCRSRRAGESVILFCGGRWCVRRPNALSARAANAAAATRQKKPYAWGAVLTHVTQQSILYPSE